MPPLGLAIVAGYAIFLDHRANRYFLLEPELNDAVRRAVAGDTLPAETLYALSAALGPSYCGNDYAAMLAACEPVRTCAPVRRRPTIYSKIAALYHLVSAACVLRVAGLHHSLRVLERRVQGVRRIKPRVSDTAQLWRIAAAHVWLSRHFDAHDACLVRSLALARHALARGCSVSLVIGVKAHPFGAHCWVSRSDSVLNDDVDTISPFTPILTVP